MSLGLRRRHTAASARGGPAQDNQDSEHVTIEAGEAVGTRCKRCRQGFQRVLALVLLACCLDVVHTLGSGFLTPFSLEVVGMLTRQRDHAPPTDEKHEMAFVRHFATFSLLQLAQLSVVHLALELAWDAFVFLFVGSYLDRWIRILCGLPVPKSCQGTARSLYRCFAVALFSLVYHHRQYLDSALHALSPVTSSFILLALAVFVLVQVWDVMRWAKGGHQHQRRTSVPWRGMKPVARTLCSGCGTMGCALLVVLAVVPALAQWYVGQTLPAQAAFACDHPVDVMFAVHNTTCVHEGGHEYAHRYLVPQFALSLMDHFPHGCGGARFGLVSYLNGAKLDVPLQSDNNDTVLSELHYLLPQTQRVPPLWDPAAVLSWLELPAFLRPTHMPEDDDDQREEEYCWPVAATASGVSDALLKSAQELRARRRPAEHYQFARAIVLLQFSDVHVRQGECATQHHAMADRVEKAGIHILGVAVGDAADGSHRRGEAGEGDDETSTGPEVAAVVSHSEWFHWLPSEHQLWHVVPQLAKQLCELPVPKS